MTNRTGSWTHYRTCNLCEAMCGLAIEMDGERIVSIKGDKDDPFSRGHICPKAVALQDVYADPDRLKQPLRRTAAGWEIIGWDEALDEAAENLKRVREQYGRNATGVYLGNPNVHNLGSMLLLSTLTRALQSRIRFTATSVDQLPAHYAARLMFGHQLLIPIPDVDRTGYFLMLGANPLASNGSLMTAAGIEGRLKAIQKRGGKVVVVDPRRTETAAIADKHLFIRPGSDVLLLLAMVQIILAKDLADPGRLAAFTNGLDGEAGAQALWQLVEDFTPEAVSEATGIKADVIWSLAREFAGAESAVVYGRIGVSTQQFGGLCQWLMAVLNILTGNLDRPGGAMFTTPAVDIVDPPRRGKMGRWQSRVRGLPEFAGELPSAAMAEEIMTPGEGQIRAMVTVAGNPVLSTPNGRQLDQALASLDYMVAIDIYLNETTRHANLILPPATGLETAHYDILFHLLAVRNSAKYSPPLYEIAGDQRHDWQIYLALAQRLGAGEAPSDSGQPVNQYQPETLLDLGLQMGPYGQEGLSLARLKEAVHGVDLGPLQTRLPERLFTEDKRINLVPQPMAADLERVRRVFFNGTAGQNGYDLALIGRRQLRSNNSWMHNAERLVRGKERCTVLMNPADAAERNLVDGQQVRVESRVGGIELPLEVDAGMMTGVVSIPHGWGHGRDGVVMSIAAAHAGASLNDLTDEALLDQLTGNAALVGVRVRVEMA